MPSATTSVASSKDSPSSRQHAASNAATAQATATATANAEADEPFDYVIEGGKTCGVGSFLQRNLKDSRTYKWAITSFIAGNLSRRYRRSVLGFCWGMVGPLLTMAIMSTSFSLLFGWNCQRSISYIFSGLMVWSFLLNSAIDGSQAMITAESYLKKVSVPKIFFPLVSLGTQTVDFLLSLVSLLVLALCCGVQFKLSLLLLPAAVAVVAVYNLGIIMLYSIGTVYFRDLPHILAITYPAFFYAIPIFYPLQAIPAKYHAIFWFNPFFWFVNLFRRIIHEGTMPSVTEWCIPVVLALVSLSAGLILLRRKERTLIYRL